ncbi:threonine/serine dehydratase [Lentzea sp. BCCO 10_0798]|uniref:Threonine/serine dehydratase n=1 Tax=Lentzea kristufekii TaxID=3095430 RepID=A0ABU4TSL5_9PSEU|nr:threonine/serine dehydratase [Lentzea sp. BCCO 10_0798]MDX8051275.1 threonine/serine dehydratase [Lentzea sp. BCCO 10_0798]
MIALPDIRSAAAVIAPHVVRTPLLPFGPGWLKPENLQPVGAFKLRGALNALARLENRANGVVAYSSGNHAQAVAFAARLHGVPAAIVMPDNTPAVKIEATKALGAEVFIVGITERVERAEALVAERGAALIPPFDHPDVIAGQGTIGLEILADLPDVEAVVVPMSGGGLISGVATAIKSLRPDVRVIGAEPELAADIAESLRTGELVRWDPLKRAQTAADALRDEPSALTWAHISEYVDDVITVSEDEILAAVTGLVRRARLIAEPSGAVAVAAQAKIGGGGVAVVSGGNVDPALLARLLAA